MVQQFKAGLIVLLAGLSVSLAAQASDEQLERWFKSDELEVPEPGSVNDGDLEFLKQPPPEPIHHHHNSLTLGPSSVKDGWVKLSQCHTHLDKVGAAQILFKEQRIRNLRVTEVRNMERAWVEGASVQMTKIRADAKLCLEAESRALKQTGPDTYELRNGPFMRRFLDGYFPLRVSMDVYFADSGLRLIGVSPEEQPGFVVERKAGEVHFDAIFEGRLITEFRFSK